MQVTLSFYDNKIGPYTGRLLGLINDKQFCNLYNRTKSTAHKLSTSRTVKLEELIDTTCKDLRLVVSVIESNTSKLIVSAKLKEMYSCSYFIDDLNKHKVKEMSFKDHNQKWVILEST